MTAHGPEKRDGRRHRVQRISLRLRLTCWVVAIFVLIQGVSAFVFWLYEGAAMREQFRERLRARATAIARVLQEQELLPAIDAATLGRVSAEELRYLQFERSVCDIVGESGLSIVQDREQPLAPNLLAGLLEASGGRIQSLDVPASVLREGEGPLHGVAVSMEDASGARHLLLVAIDESQVRRQVALVGQVLTITLFVGAVAAAVAGWFIAGIAVRPFDRLRSLAQRLSPESIGERIEFGSASSEVVRLTDELDLARRRIERGFAAQERFLSNVSHEIKSPIATLLLEASTLRRDGLPSDAASFADTVAEEADRLGRLVESFLTLTRVQHASDDVARRPCSANDLVMESVEHCFDLAGLHRVSLAPRLIEDGGDVDASIAGEPELLATMLDNLVRNAIRFSPAGGVVDIVATATDDAIEIRVRDRGPGIPPDRLETIFDRFAQAPSEQRRGRGHGLGLAIALGIAELHGGAIVAANHPEEGCVFTVSLPRHNAVAEGVRTDPGG